MKNLLKPLVFAIPFAIILSWTLYFVWVPIPGEGGTKLFGLFYPQSSDSWASSFEYQYYWKGILINFPVYFIIGILIYWLTIKRMNRKLITSLIAIVLWAFVIWLNRISYLFFSDFSFLWDYDSPELFVSPF